MKTVIIEIEADMRVLKDCQYNHKQKESQDKRLKDRLESTLVWFGMQNIKINIKQKKNELVKEDSRPVSEYKA